MTSLGSTHTVTAFLPGDPGALRADAARWRDRGHDCELVYDTLRSLDVSAVWSGAAATASQASIDTAATTWAHAATAHQHGADEINAYATILEEAQDEVRRAIAMNAQAESTTKHARTVYEDQLRTQYGAAAVLAEPSMWIVEQFIDPGATVRAHAQKILDTAIQTVQDAGDTAATALGEAASTAQIVDAILTVTGAFAQEQARNLVNSAASFGNAMLQHPDLTADLIGGYLLLDLAAGGEVGGVALDATGVGALGGVPLNIAMVGVGAAGATAVGAAGGSLIGHALGDSRTEVWKREDRGDGRDTAGKFADGSRQAYDDSKMSEQQALDELEKEAGAPIDRSQPLAKVDGVDFGRKYDGLQLKPDGTYEAVEIKSGPGAHRSPAQNAFDKLVSYDNPATARLPDGTEIKITSVRLHNVNTEGTATQ